MVTTSASPSPSLAVALRRRSEVRLSSLMVAWKELASFYDLSSQSAGAYTPQQPPRGCVQARGDIHGNLVRKKLQRMTETWTCEKSLDLEAVLPSEVCGLDNGATGRQSSSTMATITMRAGHLP